MMRALAVLTLISPCMGLTIKKVTYPEPESEKRSARDAKISRDGQWVAFQSDSDFESTGLAANAYQALHVWINDLQNNAFQTISNSTKPSDKDAKRVSVDATGAHACYDSEIPGEESIFKWTNGEEARLRITSLPAGEINIQSPDGRRNSMYCDISADGTCVVFYSDAQLIDLNETHKCNTSAEKQGCVEVGKSKPQIYLTCDDGASFTMVTEPSLATESRSYSPQISGDGNFVAFRSSTAFVEGAEMTSAGRVDEAYLYEVATGKLAKVTNPGVPCDKDEIYAKLVELHGEEKLNNVSVTRGSTSSCQYFAKEGYIPAVGTTGVGAPDQPSISDSGRFVSFSTTFDIADQRGTYEASLMDSFAHLFLFDAHLGITWQVTSDGFPGDEHDQFVEDFCCPSASASKQRGACEENYELQGQCCWQKACGFPTLNSMLAGDGNSIVFLSDHDHTGAQGTLYKDMDIFHYYIPTSTFTRVTATNDADDDDLDPSISYDGDKIAFHSNFDYVNNVSLDKVYQVFVAELSMGCSGSAAATNYVEAPDVETCCTWSEIEPHAAGAAVVTVKLTFNLNQSSMIEKIPFETADEVDRGKLCGRVAEAVKSDVACALDVPPSLLTVDTSAEACSWATNVDEKVTVELHLHQLCEGSAGDLAEPSVLADALKSHHGEPASRLWRGYLTKALDSEVAPVVATVAATEGLAVTCPAQLPSTPAPTTAPTPAPTPDPTPKEEDDDVDPSESSTDRYLLSMFTLAAIGLQ